MRAEAEKGLSEGGEERRGCTLGQESEKGRGAVDRGALGLQTQTQKRKEEEERKGDKFTWQHIYSHTSMLSDWLKRFDIFFSAYDFFFLTDVVNPGTVQHEVC